MYQFARVARLDTSKPREAADWAVRITEKVNQISGVPAQLWASFVSPDVGLHAWSMTVEEAAEIETIDSKLAVDNGFLDLIAEGGQYVLQGSVQDTLATIVHATPGATTGDYHYAQVTTAQLAPGNMRKGIELGIGLLDHGHRVSGLEGIFESAITGPYGTVTWVTLADSFAQLQKAEEALYADASFVESIDDEASKAYQPTGTTVSCLRRIA